MNTVQSIVPPSPLQAGQLAVVLRKSQNLIDISVGGDQPLPDPLRRLLEPELKYNFIQRHYGIDRYDPIDNHVRTMTVLPKQIFRYDKTGRLVTNFGFARRMFRVLRQNGYQVSTVDLCPDHLRSRPTCYVPDPEKVHAHFQFRYRQEECLLKIMAARCGLIHAVTGFGKMAMIAMVCLAYPNAKIHVVTRGTDLVKKIVDYLTRYLPSVGQFGAGKHRWGNRVTVFSVDSLHHSDYDADFLLTDEGHLLLTDRSAKALARYQTTRNFTFTATPTGRLDGTDKRLEALFGEAIFFIPYQEAVAHGLVVQIRAEWHDVFMEENPCQDIEHDVFRKRWGVWTNGCRNQIIARAVRRYPDEQVLILVDTIEHGAHLMKELHPDGYVFVYDKIEPYELEGFKTSGFLPKDSVALTPKGREELRKQFEAGTLRKVISTVWDTGIDPIHLGVVCRAGAGSSEIADRQEPGRACRIVRDAQGNKIKEVGILIDFCDQFDSKFKRRADGRRRSYKSMGWDNVLAQGDNERPLE